MANIPTLETDRLILRAHCASDFEAYAQMWADPAVVRYISPQPLSREGSWGRMLRQAGVWQMLGFGFFAIEEKASGRFIGEAGFHDLHRDLLPTTEGTLEAGWGVIPETQGKGLAREAMLAAIAWADGQFPGQRMTCIIDPDNQPSITLATRLGFVELARTTYHGGPITVFERKELPVA